MLDQDDHNLTILLASSSASLDRSPKKNWVENAGNLPPYVRKVARGIEKSGRPLSQAIAIAIGRIKKWAAGGDDVDADTRAKAQKALAQWEALKAKNKAKQVVKATAFDGEQYLTLAAGDLPSGSFDVDRISRAWFGLQENARKEWRKANPRRASDYDGPVDPEEGFPFLYIRSTWTDFIIVEQDLLGGPLLLKIPYAVTDTEVRFGSPVAVKQTFEEVSLSHGEYDEWAETIRFSAEDDGPLTENEILLLKAGD